MMAKAFKCELCGDIMEGIPENKTPRLAVPDSEITYTIMVAVYNAGAPVGDVCVQCLCELLQTDLFNRGLKEWRQPKSIRAGDFEVVQHAPTLKTTPVTQMEKPHLVDQ
jgi:hypothetical protein